MAEQPVPEDLSTRQKKESGSLFVVQLKTVPETEQLALRNGGLVKVTVSEAI